MRYVVLAIAIVLAETAVGSALWAEDAPVSSESLRSAIAKAIPLLETASRGSADHRSCFTCHSQAVPVFALIEALQQGFAIDEENFQRQVKLTVEHLARGKQSYLEGRGQGGKILTAGYALWTLEAAEHQADETTSAVAHFLLNYQRDSDHWKQPGSRPPSSGSDFTATYVALRGLATYATAQQKLHHEERRQKALQWLTEAEASDTEDRVFRLWAMPYAQADDKLVQQAVDALLTTQRDDGGWAQRKDMTSDAYATATALVALRRAGNVAAEHPAVKRGVRYLLDTQQEDGSWQVTTRAKPIQTYYESGFPHGKDQFISIAASGWSVVALALSLPPDP